MHQLLLQGWPFGAFLALCQAAGPSGLSQGCWSRGSSPKPGLAAAFFMAFHKRSVLGQTLEEGCSIIVLGIYLSASWKTTENKGAQGPLKCLLRPFRAL